MTTIAWDGKTLAADSLATSSGMVVSTNEQKIFVPQGEDWSVNGHPVAAFATAGDCGCEFEIAELLKEGITYSTKYSPAFDFACIIITEDNECVLLYKDAGSEFAKISRQDGFYAIGSGYAIATTAMHLGKSAIEAVNAAIQIDTTSGGNISVFTTIGETVMQSAKRLGEIVRG